MKAKSILGAGWLKSIRMWQPARQRLDTLVQQRMLLRELIPAEHTLAAGLLNHCLGSQSLTRNGNDEKIVRQVNGLLRRRDEDAEKKSGR